MKNLITVQFFWIIPLYSVTACSLLFAHHKVDCGLHEAAMHLFVFGGSDE